MVIITVSGTAGSGKSTLAKNLILKLGAKRVYAGALFRELARIAEMTLDEFLFFVDLQPEIDVAIDEIISSQARKLSAKGHIVVVEGRAQPHFLQESVKLFVTVSPKIAADRIWEDLQTDEGKSSRNEREYRSKQDLLRQIKEIKKRNRRQYKKIYGFDYLDMSNYDYVLDTGKLSRENALSEVLNFIDQYI